MEHTHIENVKNFSTENSRVLTSDYVNKLNAIYCMQIILHGVLTFQTEVMSPPNRKINYFLMLRHLVTRIFLNKKYLSRETAFPLPF